MKPLEIEIDGLSRRSDIEGQRRLACLTGANEPRSGLEPQHALDGGACSARDHQAESNARRSIYDNCSLDRTGRALRPKSSAGARRGVWRRAAGARSKGAPATATISWPAPARAAAPLPRNPSPRAEPHHLGALPRQRSAPRASGLSARTRDLPGRRRAGFSLPAWPDRIHPWPQRSVTLSLVESSVVVHQEPTGGAPGARPPENLVAVMSRCPRRETAREQAGVAHLDQTSCERL